MVIFDMDMPSCCRNCKFINHNGTNYICTASSNTPIFISGYEDDDVYPLDIRQEWCPIKGEVEDIKGKEVEVKINLKLY